VTFVLVALAAATQPERHRHYWQQTPNETIWNMRYSNCDYGFFVALPNQMVAHGVLPPAPNHGFIVSLPDVERTSSAAIEEARFVWVNAEYPQQQIPLRQFVDDRLQITQQDKRASQLLARNRTKLDGIPAVQLRSQYETTNGPVIEERIIAVRSGRIAYEIGLKTRAHNYVADKAVFERVRSGFRAIALPRGECSND
jgi:hypothetical protein